MMKLLLVFMLIITLIMPVHVFGDYIDYMPFKIESQKPVICIMEPDNTNILFDDNNIPKITRESILDWKYNLDKYTGNSWDMKFKTYTVDEQSGKTIKHFSNCDVFIIYEINNMDNNTLGYVNYYYSDSKHKYSIMTIYTGTYGTVITNLDGIGQWIFINHFKNELLSDVIKHEFGHVMGLGHKTKTLEYNFTSIMDPTLKITDEKPITPNDLAAVVSIYGNDGFNKIINPPMPKKYGR